VEETGAAQYYRDSRISTIYEGTTGIQANDLVGRKVGREGGQTAFAFIKEMEKLVPMLEAANDVNLKAFSKQFVTFPTNQGAVNAGSVHYLKLAGTVSGGWMMGRAALIAAKQLAVGEGDADFLKAKIITTRFYGDHIVTLASGFADAITMGADSVLAMEEGYF
jgi:3-(methylthio)propanoyl-CoA dehydrogenase